MNAQKAKCLLLALLLGSVSQVFAAEQQPVQDQVQVLRNAKPLDANAHQMEALAYLNVQTKFMNLISNPAFMPPEQLQEIDFSVRSMAFYRVADRQNKKFPRHFYDAIEQKLVNKFLQVRRFSVHECFECKTTRILLKEKHFEILRQLDSNGKFKEIGEKIGVDSFVLWDAYLHKDEPVVNVRIVSAENGQIRWSTQFHSEPVFEYTWEIYSSYWNLPISRASTGSGPDLDITTTLNFGTRMLSRSTISRFLYYGFGLDFFFNTVDRDNVSVYGVNVNGKLSMELDPIFGMKSKNYGNWLVYAGVGQTYVNLVPTIGGRLGLEVRFNRRAYIDIGYLYFQEAQYEQGKKTGYESAAVIKGLGTEVSLGARF